MEANSNEVESFVGRHLPPPPAVILEVSCTCKMGTDPLSVIDPRTMRVHWLEGLRVVDASALPYVTNGNIYGPVMMLAEKASCGTIPRSLTGR